MTGRVSLLLAGSIVGALLMAACQAATPTPTVGPVATATTAPSTPTPAPTAAAPTSTPTAQPAPTATRPAATATPTAVAVRTPTAVPTTTSAPRPTATTAGAAPRRGGVLLRNGGLRPPSFDTHRASSLSDVDTLGPVYNTLMFNPGGTTVECDVCTSFEVRDGGTTLVYNLRKDVKFTNGHVMDSADVKYSLEKVMGLLDGVVSPRAGFIKEYIKTIETPDSSTVVLRLYRPAAALNAMLTSGMAGIYIKGTTSEDLKLAPLGSGPFVIKEVLSGSSIELARNPTYFKSGFPLLDGIKSLVIADAAASEAAFLTKRIDVVHFAQATSPDFVRLVGGQQGPDAIRYYPFYGESRIQGMNFNVTSPYFSDKRVRQAVCMAIDRDAYSQAVYNSQTVLMTMFQANSQWGRSEQEIRQLPGFRKPKDADIAEAKRLIAQAGHPSGLIVPEMTGRDTFAADVEFMQAQVAKIGITAKAGLYPGARLFEKMEKLDYHFAAYLFSLTSGDPDEAFGQLFISGASRNWFGYSNNQIDQLYQKQSEALDPAVRKQTIRQMEDIMMDDPPGCFTIDRELRAYMWPHAHWLGGITRYTAFRQEATWLDRK